MLKEQSSSSPLRYLLTCLKFASVVEVKRETGDLVGFDFRNDTNRMDPNVWRQ